MEPITPNHLILMKSKIVLTPPGNFLKEDMYATKRWRRVQYLIEQWHIPRRNLEINDIVIIKEDMLPRNQWQLGRVVEVIQGNDGLVRRVKVQTGERKLKTKLGHHSKPSIIERPIQKLVVLLESE